MYIHNIMFLFQSKGTSHGFDHYRANMFRHLTTLRNTHDSKDHPSHIKHVNNWMETTEMNVKSEKSVSLYSSHPTDNKHTPQRTTSPKPFTSDPPDSANVHKPQPVKNGSTPPNYENQNEFEKFMYDSKLDVQSDEKSGNSEKTDKSQFSFKSWMKREPKLRFKAFSGEWEEKKLSMVSNITTGGSNREDSTKNDGEYTFFDRSEDVRTSARYLFDDEAIIIAGEGQKFTPKYYKGKFDLHQRTYAILELQIIGKFLYYYIDKYKDYFLQNAVGSTVKSLRLPMFQQMPVLLPILTEQQKIANTLSTLDSLIEAQNQQINHLKQHKKGLMQQLFVSSEVGV